MAVSSIVRAPLLLLLSSALARADVTPATDAPAAEQAPPELLSAHADDPSGERETFRGAVERSLRQNPQIVVATQELARAHALLEQVRAASLPTLSANGAYTRLDGDRVLNGAVIAGENQLAANLTLAVPLIAGKSWAQWAHAGDQVKVAETALADVRRQLGITTGRAYLTVLTQRKLVEVALTARDAARAYHDFALGRFKGGVGNRIDEVRAAQQVATDESQLATSRTQLRRAREALGVLLGAEGPIDATTEPELDPRGTVDDALAQVGTRSDVRDAIIRRDAAHKVTRDSYTDYLPLLSGLVQPFYQDPPTLTVPKTGWQAELILALPLYDGGLRYGQRRERSALEREAAAQLEGTLRQARSEVRVAFDAVREADRALQAARDAARLAKEALELSNMAYRAGASTNLELIDAQRASLDADTQSALAEDAARQARLDLLAASGRFPDTK